MDAPVMNELLSDAKNAIVSPTSEKTQMSKHSIINNIEIIERKHCSNYSRTI